MEREEKWHFAHEALDGGGDRTAREQNNAHYSVKYQMQNVRNLRRGRREARTGARKKEKPGPQRQRKSEIFDTSDIRACRNNFSN